MINETKKIIDCIQSVNSSHMAMIDSFSIDVHTDGILLTIWEREFPIYIDLIKKEIKYDSFFDKCDKWTMDLDDFSVINALMHLLQETLFW